MNPAKFFIQLFYNHVTALKLESRLFLKIGTSVWRKFRKNEIAWVLESLQFWFEYMVLSHYENNIWREHFRISRQNFRFVCDLVRPHLARQDANDKSDSSGEASSCLSRLATGNTEHAARDLFLELEDALCCM